MVGRLQFKLRDLPMIVEIIGDDGQRAMYYLLPASQKLGASLQKVPGGYPPVYRAPVRRAKS